MRFLEVTFSCIIRCCLICLTGLFLCFLCDDVADYLDNLDDEHQNDNCGNDNVVVVALNALNVREVSEAASATAEGTNGTDALDDAVNTLLDTNPISNQFEIAAMNIEYDFGLQAEDVVSYKGVKSNDNGDAGLVLVIEAADGKAEDIANQLTAYQQDQVAFYGNYAEFAQAQSNVENAVIAFKDNRVVMAIASNECTADLDSAVDSALTVSYTHLTLPTNSRV